MRGRDFNVDYTDQLGRTPLHLAVVNDHKEVGDTTTVSSWLHVKIKMCTNVVNCFIMRPCPIQAVLRELFVRRSFRPVAQKPVVQLLRAPSYNRSYVRDKNE